jgi:sterol 3beta-glucosyltransferase
MYITQNHICFYAYLAKKSVSQLRYLRYSVILTSNQNIIAKSGNLSKRGRYNPKYNRYWFTLKGDVLSYYTNSSDTYFPSGDIDLRYGISASLVHPKEKGKDTRDFSVVTNQRVYHFKADSAPSAKEWVKTLQKVIFRSHNDGDSVKISLPIENVIDIEQSPVIPFAETLKISVVHSDDTYAVDEVRQPSYETCRKLTRRPVLLHFLQFWARRSERLTFYGGRHHCAKDSPGLPLPFPS